MYTSDEAMKRAAVNCRNYAAVSAFMLLFGAVYEYFSHGVFSAFMVYAFLIPLLGGYLPFRLFLRFGRQGRGVRLPPRASTQLYGGGIAAFGTGSVVKGVLDIYGTTNAKTAVYPWAGAVLVTAAAAVWGIRLLADRRQKKRAD